MVTAQSLRNEINEILKNGEMVRFKFFNFSGADTGYDDEVVITQSGVDTWVSGLIQPLSTLEGSDEAILVEQGRLLTNDLKMYIEGSAVASGLFNVGIGSPTPSREYGIVPDGIESWEINGSSVYKKLFLRVLTNGSFISE